MLLAYWLVHSPLPIGVEYLVLATLSLAVVLGLTLGAIRVRGIRLGVSAVLFSSLLFGQLGLAVDAKVLEFLRELRKFQSKHDDKLKALAQ